MKRPAGTSAGRFAGAVGFAAIRNSGGETALADRSATPQKILFLKGIDPAGNGLTARHRA